MPMTLRQYVQIKQNLKLWFIIEPEYTDHAALEDMFKECRNALQQIVDAQEEGNPPSWWVRVRRKLRGS